MIHYLYALRGFIFYGQEIPARETCEEAKTRQEVRGEACDFEVGRRLRGTSEAPEKFFAGAAEESLCNYRPFPRLYAHIRPLSNPVQGARARGEYSWR